MKRVLIAYGTTEGHTATIADVVADALRAHGHDVTTLDVKRTAAADLDGYDGAILGSSVHLGKHDKHIADFVRRNQDILVRIPSAFFSVSLAAHGDDAEAQGYVERFVTATGWHPAQTATFSGALLYTRYGFLKRLLMQQIARTKPGDLGTDSSRDYIYTEWDAVTRFAEHFAQGLDAEIA